MPFLMISGTFHLVGKTKAGKSSGFQPDGDSIQFRPKDPTLLQQLQRHGSEVKLTALGSTQLRFEGIDALELHFSGSHQPRPLADIARDHLTGLLGLNPVPYKQPEGVQVLPPVERDAAAGFILTRALETYGRPVAFAFAGEPPDPSGTEVFLKPALLRKSLNYKLVAAGHAYPLYYDTLFADLRETFTKAAQKARNSDRGLWPEDRGRSGLTISSQAGLKHDAVVFPKLYRRLHEYLSLQPTPTDLTGFLTWLDDKREQVLDLQTTNISHFDDVLTVDDGSVVRLAREPEQLVFISAKTTSRSTAPWLRV